MMRTSYSLMILFLYVDDLLITGSLASTIVASKNILHVMIYMKDMGLMHFFLGLDINQDVSGIKLSQTKYVRDLLVRFHMTDYKLEATPFLSGVHLKDGRDTLLVYSTFY